MEMTYQSNLVLPVKYAAIDQEEATYLDGGELSVGTVAFTALGIYGAYMVYTNLRSYVQQNREQVKSSVTSGASTFMNVFEKVAVLKLAYEVLTFIF